MFQSNVNRIAVICFGVALWAAWPNAASAQQGGPPVGAWHGKFADGSGSLNFVLQANGTCLYGPVGTVPTVGTASWKQTSPVGGIVTLRYRNGRFENFAYYSITWVDANTIVLSDPFFRVTMKKQ